ncbi:universal stress protein family, putative [Synechococcus sp. PCC 7335]|uniref:universal stress protein n=1 Tax=Synechococcus sp. (strain ATCC 29403 / PCC 7335) TaxID=91464 RepID=UPI00017EDCD6|nr:universal stress protein [Synechococcus sp. PCC 7335]EDX86440.1 universal stress protein family, putative [Synechococcus sp. PCC 7335]
MNWLKKKTVLVPTDFSESSYEAIAVAKAYVEDASGLKIIHSLSPLHPADPAAMWDTLTDDERKQKVHDFLSKKMDELGYSGVHVEITLGDPATQVIEYAEKIGVEMIIMPSQGRKGLSRFLIGSVAERVIRSAHCPVLVLKS